MSHKHTICEEGYTIEQCRCPGPITAVLPCPGGEHAIHQHTRYRYEAKTGPAILIEETVTPTISVDTVDDALSGIYGASPMVTALATHIVANWDEWDRNADEFRDLHYRLHMEIWNWFAGGGTAEIAADRIFEAVGRER